MLKKITIIVLFLFGQVTAQSQSIGFSGGPIWNKYYNTPNDDGHFQSEYESQVGYSFRLVKEGAEIMGLPARVTFGFAKQSGGIDINFGGKGGGSTVRGTVERINIRLGVFPINYEVLGNLNLSAGVQLGMWANTTSSGTIFSWRIGSPDPPGTPGMPSTSSTEYKEDDLVETDTDFNFGLTGRIGYRIKIGQNFYLVPELEYTYGLVKEFELSGTKIKSNQFFAGIGVLKKIKE